jgi:hypothetical protein
VIEDEKIVLAPVASRGRSDHGRAEPPRKIT